MIMKYHKIFPEEAKHKSVQWHISGKYEKEIEQQSDVNIYILRVLFLNESKIDEMCQILEELQQYLPLIKTYQDIYFFLLKYTYQKKWMCMRLYLEEISCSVLGLGSRQWPLEEQKTNEIIQGFIY